MLVCISLFPFIKNAFRVHSIDCDLIVKVASNNTPPSAVYISLKLTCQSFKVLISFLGQARLQQLKSNCRLFLYFFIVFANAEHFIGSKSEKIILGFFKA